MLNWVKAKMSNGSERSQLLVDYYKQLDNDKEEEEEEEFDYIVCVAGVNQLPKKVVGVICCIDSFVFCKPHDISCRVVRKHASYSCKQVYIIPDNHNQILFRSSTLYIYWNVISPMAESKPYIMSSDGVFLVDYQQGITPLIKASSNKINEVCIVSTKCNTKEHIVQFVPKFYKPHRLIIIFDFPQNLFYSFLNLL